MKMAIVNGYEVILDIALFPTLTVELWRVELGWLEYMFVEQIIYWLKQKGFLLWSLYFSAGTILISLNYRKFEIFRSSSN